MGIPIRGRESLSQAEHFLVSSQALQRGGTEDIFITFAADTKTDCKFIAAQDWKQTWSWQGGIKNRHGPDKVKTDWR